MATSDTRLLPCACAAANACCAWLRGPTSPWQPELRAIRASAELQPPATTGSPVCGRLGQRSCIINLLLLQAGTLAWIKGCHQWLPPQSHPSRSDSVCAAGLVRLSCRPFGVVGVLQSDLRYLSDHCLLPKDPFSPERASSEVVRAMGHSTASKRRQRARLGRRERQAETAPVEAGNDGLTATPAPDAVICGEDSAAASSSFTAAVSATEPESSSPGEVTHLSSSSTSGLHGLPLVHVSARGDEGSTLDEADVEAVIAETVHQTTHAQMNPGGTVLTVSDTAGGSDTAGSSTCPPSGFAASAVEVVTSSSDEELPTHGRKRGRPPTPPRPRPLEALAHTDEELVPTDYAGYPEQGPDEPRMQYLRRCLREALLASTHPSTDWAKAKDGKVLLCACQLSPILLSVLLALAFRLLLVWRFLFRRGHSKWLTTKVCPGIYVRRQWPWPECCRAALRIRRADMASRTTAKPELVRHRQRDDYETPCPQVSSHVRPQAWGPGHIASIDARSPQCWKVRNTPHKHNSMQSQPRSQTRGLQQRYQTTSHGLATQAYGLPCQFTGYCCSEAEG